MINDDMLDTILITEEIMASIMYIAGNPNLSSKNKQNYMHVLASAVYYVTAYATFVLNEGPIDEDNRPYLEMTKRDLLWLKPTYEIVTEYCTETLPNHAELIGNMDRHYNGIEGSIKTP